MSQRPNTGDGFASVIWNIARMGIVFTLAMSAALAGMAWAFILFGQSLGHFSL
jgi:hypothetical protein